VFEVVSPADFLEPIEVAGKTISEEGYKMDGNDVPDMRIHAGMGGCRCCDYFIENGKSVVLIEETRLLETIENLKEEPVDRARAIIRDENVLKVYGALLVLCRMAANFPGFQKITQTRKFHFWLVVSDAQFRSMLIGVQNLGVPTSLSGPLGSALGKGFNIKIVPADELTTEISNYHATP